MSDPAEARLRAGVTRYFMAVAWITAHAELAGRKLRCDQPKAFMSAFLQQMHQEVRRVQMAIEPGCTDDEIWRMLFDDADLYSRAFFQAAMTQRCEDVPLVAGLRWFDERSLFNLASAAAYGGELRGPDHRSRHPASDRRRFRGDALKGTGPTGFSWAHDRLRVTGGVVGAS